MQKEHNPTVGEHQQYVGPFRLEKTLGKGQTGKFLCLSQEIRNNKQNTRFHNDTDHVSICIPGDENSLLLE